jgi:hypothetical protein
VVIEVIVVVERVEQGLKVGRIRNVVTSLNTMTDDELKEFHLRNRYQIIPYLNIPYIHLGHLPIFMSPIALTPL